MLTFDPLDNPVWQALQTAHKPYALGTGCIQRYPADMLPFMGYDPACKNPLPAITDWMQPGEQVYIVGNLPVLPDNWSLVRMLDCAQMICEIPPAALISDHPVVRLSVEYNAEMMAFIHSVQPGFFKQDTHLLGHYYGIKIDGKIVAMAGERMRLEHFTEVSAVCTHPDFTGRGFAQLLSVQVCQHIFSQGLIPVLHVLNTNTRAIKLYEKLGFVKRREIPFCLLQYTPA